MGYLPKAIILGYRLHFRRASLAQLAHCGISFIRKMLATEQSPLSILLALTYSCQCNCSHCGILNLRKKTNIPLLDINELKKLVILLKSLGVLHISLTGGEAVLREDIFEIVRIISRAGIIVSLGSSGYPLDKEKIKKLTKSGLNLLKVSLDNSNPEIHNKIRRCNGCFERAISAMAYSAEEKLPCAISVTLTRDSLRNGELGNIVSLGKKLKVAGIKIGLLAFSGEALNLPYAAFTEDDFRYLERFMKEQSVYIRDVMSGVNECCFLLKRNCYISAYGDVQPCIFIPEKFGNIRERNFIDIWKEMIKHPLYNYSPIDCYSNGGRLQKIFQCDEKRS